MTEQILEEKELKLVISLESSDIFTTPKIQGELNSILFNFPIRCTLEIYSEFGYPIYSVRDISGVQYLPIRCAIEDPFGHLRNFQSTKFKLNERLIIRVTPLIKGVVKEVRMIIRYD